MRVGRLFQFFILCVRYATPGDLMQVQVVSRGGPWLGCVACSGGLLPPCCLLASHSLPFPSPSQHVFLFGSGGTGDQTRAANMSLSRARPVRGPWIEGGGHVAGTRVPT